MRGSSCEPALPNGSLPWHTLEALEAEYGCTETALEGWRGGEGRGGERLRKWPSSGLIRPLGSGDPTRPWGASRLLDELTLPWMWRWKRGHLQIYPSRAWQLQHPLPCRTRLTDRQLVTSTPFSPPLALKFVPISD